MLRKFVGSYISPSLFYQSHATLTSVCVVGAGLMGSGIAQVTAQSGYTVRVVDADSVQMKKSLAGIRSSLTKIAKKKYSKDDEATKFVEDNITRISYSTDLTQSVGSSELIIEAIVEDLSLKHNLFRILNDIAPSDTILATNTSSLSLSSISGVLQRKDKFGGLHFFNPVPMMKLVEVIRTDGTSDDTFKTLMEFSKSLGKTPVECKDTPGFIANRLLVPFLVEAIRLVERTGVSYKDVDTTMKLGAGHPMGPFELADLVGLDTLKFILKSFQDQCPGEETFYPVLTLNHFVSQGKLGRKTNEGFFKYDSAGKIIN